MVMPEYVALAQVTAGQTGVRRPIPAAYDFLFVYWYLIRFAGESPFSHSALDIKTYAMALLGERVPRVDEAEHAAGVVRRRCRTRTSPSTTRSARARCSATCSPPATASWATLPSSELRIVRRIFPSHLAGEGRGEDAENRNSTQEAQRALESQPERKMPALALFASRV